MPDFRRRSSETELMDDLSAPADDVERALEELETINRFFGGLATSIAGVAALLGPEVREFTLLDVGAGGGDFARAIVSWAARRGLRARVLGIDLLPAAVAHARSRSAGMDPVRFEAADLFELPGTETYDVVHSAMMLHHLDDARAAEALRKMHALARRGVVVNDIHRHPLAYGSISLLARLFSRSRLVRSDAPISVLRAFRRAEIAAIVARAGLPPASIRWRWAFRWQVVLAKEIMGA